MNDQQIFEKLFISSWLDSIQELLWPGRPKHYADPYISKYSGTRSIKDEFMRTSPAILWEQFLDQARQLSGGRKLVEFEICEYIHGLLMQIFDKVETYIPCRVKIYAEEYTKLSHVTFVGETPSGYCVMYKMPLDNTYPLDVFIHRGTGDEVFDKVYTIGTTWSGRQIDVLVVYDDIVVCQYPEGAQSDCMRMPISSINISHMYCVYG